MSEFIDTETSNSIFNDTNTLTSLLDTYSKFMILNIFVDDDELKQKYIEAADLHNSKISNNINCIDAGFDLYAPEKDENSLRFKQLSKLDFDIVCSAEMHTDQNKVYSTGYYMHPRSSLSKTKLRLANSTGIIDAGYRGHLMAMFDVIHRYSGIDSLYHCGKKFDRYIQICAPGLVPILVKVVDNIEDLGMNTERGTGGFGSTGR
jgi:dUTPase